jgi:2-C-methyl-D-erythritol 4-phosphate cytidylyltransferase
VTWRFAGAVIVAAGRGERFGDTGKVLAPAAGRPLLAWSLDAVCRAQTVAEVVVVCGEHTQAAIEELVEGYRDHLPVRTCLGGAHRQDSVRNGLRSLSPDLEIAVIHDAARPLATAAMFDDLALAARDHGAAIAAVPVTDTIKEVDGDRIVGTVPRAVLRAAQTPQAYRIKLLLREIERAETAFTDEAGMLEVAGVPVIVRPGDHANIKVTVPEDLVLVDALLRARQAEGTSDVST